MQETNTAGQKILHTLEGSDSWGLVCARQCCVRRQGAMNKSAARRRGATSIEGRDSRQHAIASCEEVVDRPWPASTRWPRMHTTLHIVSCIVPCRRGTLRRATPRRAAPRRSAPLRGAPRGGTPIRAAPRRGAPPSPSGSVLGPRAGNVTFLFSCTGAMASEGK